MTKEIKTTPSWDDLRAKLASDSITDRNLAHWFLQDDADASYLPLLHELVVVEDENDAHLSAAAGVARLQGVSQYRRMIEIMADAYAKRAGEHGAPLDAFIDSLQNTYQAHAAEVDDILLGLLRHERANVRALAAFLYGMTEFPSFAPLRAVLVDDNPFVRVNAVLATRSVVADETIVPELIPLLQDGNDEVRGMVAYVLADRRDPLALPALQRTAREDPSKPVRQAATHATRRIKGTERWLWWGIHGIDGSGLRRPGAVSRAVKSLIRVVRSGKFFS